MSNLKTTFFVVFLAVQFPFYTGCLSAYKKSVGDRDQDRQLNRTFVADFPTVWEAAIDAMKASPMEVVNRENGTLETKWIDNTSERNLLDAAGSVNPYVKAQYRFKVNLGKAFYDGRPSVRVTVEKEQQFQRDILEGWVSRESDGIQENSLLYRIGKLVEFKIKLMKIENRKMKRKLQDMDLDS